MQVRRVVNKAIAILVSQLMILNGLGFPFLAWKIEHIILSVIANPHKNGKLGKAFFLVSSKVFSTIQVLVSYTILKLVEIRDKLFFTYIEIKSLFLVSSDKWL